jgi:hypothetical protein
MAKALAGSGKQVVLSTLALVYHSESQKVFGLQNLQ